MPRIIILSLGLLYSTCILAQQPKDNSPYAKTARTFSKWYEANSPDSTYALFNDKVKAQLTIDAWKMLFQQVRTGMGGLSDFTLDIASENYANYVAFKADSSMGLVLSIDNTYHIQGIFPKQNPAKTSYHTNYKVHTPDGDLSGELLMPTIGASDQRAKPIPVVLIIAGSGPTDRNGNSILGVKADYYKQLAAGLAKQGIASLRYDKRFIGESAQFKGRTDSVLFGDYVNDARACVRQLRADTNFSSVVIVGHSEGALIGAIAAREEKVDAFVSLAGTGVPAEAILRRQLAQQGMDKAAVEKTLDSLEKRSGLYIASWTKYDPAQEISKLKIPVLIIQGLRDIQVGREDAEKLAVAAPKARVIYMDSMNHVLKAAPLDRPGNLATYSNPALPLYPDLVPAITAFIGSSRRQ